MQRPNDEKRAAIMRAAVRMFSRRQFHEVRLDDVAAAARIGKGTVYIYFKSKEDLFDSLVLEGLSEVVQKLGSRAKAEIDSSAWRTLEHMIGELVQWAYINPHIFQMMQAASDRVRPRIARKRKELGKMFEIVLRRGVRTREIIDAAPGLTAQLLPACVRSAIRYGPERIPAKTLAKHILRVIGTGIKRGPR
ncbi:MAG: TetR/AcrR family transcriptional regulator [Burkholderiales bacterium]|nr:TetR/AcrR family transcriptional regulator [Phycisphaerae bacterium]